MPDPLTTDGLHARRSARVRRTWRCLTVLLWLLAIGVCSAQPNGAFREFYGGITGGTVANLTNHANFPNNWTSTNIVTSFETAQNVADNYGQRLRALITAPTTGSYLFWIASDDRSVLFLSTDESEFNKSPIATVNSSTTYRQWTKETNQQSVPITLEAGRRYYLEALHKEGTGSDNLSVRWRLPSGSTEEPIPSSRLRPYGRPAVSSPAFTSQPTNLTVWENATAIFRVGVSNLDLISYQWQRNGTNLTNARGATLSLTATLAENGATFRCIATNALGSNASSVATLSVLTDTNPPTLLSAANVNTNTLLVMFSEAVEASSATNTTNYSLSGGVSVLNAVFGTTNRVIQLTTTPLQRGTYYTLMVNRIRDRAAAANVIATNSQYTFAAQLKGIYREVFTNLPGNAVVELTSSANFPDAPSSAVLLTSAVETPANVADSYGQRLRALLIPPVTGNYTFWIAADETASLLLGTNASPTSARQIASVTTATLARFWDAQTNQKSSPIALTAGQTYYFETLMKEGISTDHLAVRWQLPDGSIEEPLPGLRLTPLGMNPPTIVAQPMNVIVTENAPAVFQVALSNVDPISYQWQQNGTNLPGATNAIFTNASVPRSLNGASLRCQLANALASTNTLTVTLTVLADQSAPTIIGAANRGLTNVVVFFSESVEAVSAARATNYSIAGATVLAAALRSDTRSVLLITSPLVSGADYLLTAGGVLDRAAIPNALAPGSQMAFRVTDFFSQDIGTLPASCVSNASGGLNITVNGGDLSGTADQFNFSHQLRTGDFDVKVRVQRLDLADPFTKFALMAREDLGPTNRHASVVATPSLAGIFFQYRTNNGGAAQVRGGFAVNYPDTWLRLQRVANQFTGFASYDGQTWTQLGTISNAMPATVFLGFAVASRNAALGTTAEARDFAENLGGVIGALPETTEPLGPSSRRTGLVICEIMYHPAPRDDGRKLEFVELFNSNPWPEDISGYRLAGDVAFTFPSGTVLPGGGLLVVARAPSDVQAIFRIANVTGPFTNNFSNKSGTVRLRNRTGAILLEVNYDSKPPWPAAADGTGHSLVLARPSFGEDDARAWAQSDRVGGSPGMLEARRFEPVRAVMINEFLAHSELPALDYIELYNHSASAVDLSGCWLSDDPATNKFRIPDGTTLAPTGFVAFTESTLGFALSASGETIFLVDSNRTRVLDAVSFGGQAKGVATGRVPDGAPSFYPLTATTPGAPNTPALPSDIIINEIMYHPVSELDDDEFVELFNRGTNVVSLAGWRFTEGIDFAFPNDALLPPGGYLVVARNAARLMTNYPNLNAANTVGDFQGSLQNSGERLALAMPDVIVTTNGTGQFKTNVNYIVVDEVAYGTGGRWGRWSDGGGSSLERIDPRADGRLAANWTDSDETAKAGWTTITATETLSTGVWTNSNSLQIYHQDAGECLIDDVSVIIAGSSNLVANGDFEAGLTNWFVQGNHARSSLEDSGFNSARSLHLRASGRGDTGANRIRTTLTSTYSNNVTGTISARVKWLRGRPEILFRLRGNHLEAPGTLNVPANLGTPGARNSRFIDNAGPAIWEVAHSPVLPAAGQPVIVTARASDVDGVAAMQLVYRLDPAGAAVSITMKDDGTGGDAVPGDGVFSTTILGQTNAALVAFYVEASDGSSTPVSARFPGDAPVRECLVRFGEIQPPSAFGTYRFWLTQANFNSWTNRERLSNEPVEGTFAYGNSRVIYNAGNQYAGSPYHSPNFNSPIGNTCDYYVTVPADDAFLGATEFTLQVPGNGGGDTACQREQTAYWLADRLDAPFLYRRSVNFIISGVRRNIILEDTQQPNGDFASQWYPDDANGDLYKVMIWFEFNDPAVSFNSVGATLGVVTNALGQKKLARYRQNFGRRAFQDSASNYTNLFNLVDSLATTATSNAYTAQILAAMDVTEWSKAFAVERIVGNSDSYSNGGGQNMYIYRPDDGAWQCLIWDIDFAFASQPSTSTLFTFSDAPITKLFGHPPFLRRYWQSLEDAANGPLLASAANPRLDAKYAAFQAAGIAATTPDPIKTYVAQRRDQILTLLAGVRAPFTIDNGGGQNFTNATTTVTLTGRAPMSVREITINGVAYPVWWTSITNWSALVPLTGRTNIFTVQGWDAQGNASSNAAVTVFFNGEVGRPEDSLVINEIMFQPAVSNASYIEIFNRSPNTTFDLWNYRLKGVDFDFAAGTLLAPRSHLVVVKDAAAFRATYATNAFIAGVFDGNLNPDGETLTLLKLGATSAEDIVIDKVKYEAATPWPEGGSPGSALQLIDAAQDNARVSNWADGSGWRRVVTNGLISSSRLILYLDTAGELLLDDIELVPGTIAGIGTNLVQNGDFETALSGPWQFYSTNVTNSAITSGQSHFGAGSLKLVFDKPGGSSAYVFQDVAGVVTNTMHTLSYWYRPTTNNANLTARLGSSLRSIVNVAGLSPTPGTNNSVAAALAPYPPLWINEVQPENPDGLADNTGTPQPWIELFNSGTNLLALDGYFLAPSYTNLAAWAFPTGTLIAPGEFRVIFADGLPEMSTGTVLHTSFRLAPTNGSVVLSRAGQILDYVNYARVPAGFSTGSWPDGQLFDRRLFYHVTPGASNDPAPVPVAINEWMASNTRTLLDPLTGRYEDWFELFNYGSVPIDLSGYFLTDDLAAKTKWAIPGGTTIAPRGFLLVWADDDSSGTNTAGNALHAGFKISKSGDELGLFNSESVAVHMVTFGAQSSDVSQGLYLNGNVGGVMHFMPEPTPGAANVITNNLFPPVLDALDDRAVTEGETLTFVCTASDPDQPAQSLTFSLRAGAPFGASIHPASGTFAWTPMESQGGATHEITVTVSDNGSPTMSDTRTFAVTVLKTNSPPALALTESLNADEGVLFNHALPITDPDLPAQALAAALVSGPPGATLGADGSFNWTPAEDDGPGVYPIQITLTDDGVPPLVATQSFTVVVREVNAAPSLAPVGDQFIVAGATLLLTNAASDPDLPPNQLTFGLAAGPADTTIHPVSGVLTWSPSATDADTTNEIVITVTDDGFPPQSDSKSVRVITDARPVVQSIEVIAGVATLSWRSLPGRSYRVQFSSTLDSPDWIDLEGDVTATDVIASKQDEVSGNEQRFYRIVARP